MAYSNQGGVKNYLGNQKMVKAPLHWQSAPNHPKTELAYITDAEKKLLIKKDLHKSLKGGVNRGPAGIMSLNGWGSRDERQNVSGAAASAAESGRNTSDTLAAGMSNQDVQDFRSAAIASGAGQNVNPGWFGPRHRVSRDELRAAKAFAPGAYRATRGNPMGNVLRGALGFFGGVPGKLMSGIMTAADYAKRKGTGAWEGIKEFGEYDTLQDYFNRNKTGALQPVETIDIREKFDRTGNNNLAVDNQVIEEQNVNPNFLALGAKDGGRIGLRTGGDPEGIEDDLSTFEFMQDQGIPFGEMASAVDPMDALNDMSLEVFGKPLDELSGEEYQRLIDMANDQAMGEQDQGIASLV